MQKKYFIFICIFISSFANCSTEPVATFEIWRNNFKQLRDPEWSDYNTTQNRWTKLGYNPQITLIEKKYNNSSSGPTLFIHDWASSKDAYNTIELCSSNNIPGDVITFNFPDASSWWKKVPYWMPFTKSNFSGEKDITGLLCILKTLHSLDCLPTVWYADSQGAATAQAVIGILNKPSETEENILTEWDIQQQERHKIINSLKTIYLLNPLISIEVTLNNYIQKKLFIFDYILPVLKEMISMKFNDTFQQLPPTFKDELTTKTAAIKKDPQSFIKKYITPVIKNCILPRLTSYNPQQKNSIDYISQWDGTIQAKIWLHLDGNGYDALNNNISIIEQLSSVVTEGHLYISCINHNDNNSFTSLNDYTIGLVDAFNRQNECAHRWGTSTQAAKRIIEIAQLTNPMYKHTIEEHLRYFSRNYTRNTWYHKITKTLIILLKVSLIGATLYYLKTHSYDIHEFCSKVSNQYLNSLKIDS